MRTKFNHASDSTYRLPSLFVSLVSVVLTIHGPETSGKTPYCNFTNLNQNKWCSSFPRKFFDLLFFVDFHLSLKVLIEVQSLNFRTIPRFKFWLFSLPKEKRGLVIWIFYDYVSVLARTIAIINKITNSKSNNKINLISLTFLCY